MDNFIKQKQSVLFTLIAFLAALAALSIAVGVVTTFTADARLRTTKKATITKVKTCLDSDGGINFQKPGEILINGRISYPDACLDPVSLKEYYCSGVGGLTYARSVSTDCQFGCNDNFCCAGSEICADGFDNDCDGGTDENDTDCFFSASGLTLTDISPSTYKSGIANAGSQPYIDRTITIRSLSSELSGQTLLRTKMDDKANSSLSVSFEISEPATVYVIGWEDSWGWGKKPLWLTQNFTPTGLSLTTSAGSKSLIYVKNYLPGKVSLGACGDGCVGNIMYFVIVKPGKPACVAENCSDNYDNDCDGKTDCSDSDCLSSSSCFSCTESWQCSDWGSCINGIQTRTCLDPDPSTYYCPVLPKPSEQQTCSSPETNCSGDPGCLFFSSWNTKTGYCQGLGSQYEESYYGDDCTDKQTWKVFYNNSLQYPAVMPGAPGNNNYLKMVTVGNGGLDGDGRTMELKINGSSDIPDIFRDPDDLYIRAYVRASKDWVQPGNLHSNTHWFSGIDTNKNTKHYLRFHAPMTSEFKSFGLTSVNQMDYTMSLGFGSDHPSGYGVLVDDIFSAGVDTLADKWYCWEIHIDKVSNTAERWYFRRDGVDITDKYYATGGDMYGKKLTDLYNSGWIVPNEYHANLWLTTYDQETLNDGWDVAAVEARNDRWVGCY
ncbi:hypothetical protein C4569_00295 [Candidatus Parcubacteria bacterium]|nr:MAG: hypothetical protein C4569_00295 [Candidatus Parcubacteria bacterium]